MKLLITGATGNVGLSVIKRISNRINGLQVFAGVRNIETDREKLEAFNVFVVSFDFENIQTFKPAFAEMDILFLLRPPQIANVSKFFEPLLAEANASKIKQIIFLSVQGVENSKIIPHYKIEKLITESKIGFTFLRPAYFMQNFTTTLYSELVNKQRIYLPAGQAKFTLIDVDDIGLVVAHILTDPQKHLNKSYELTNNETLTFGEMAEKISQGIRKTISFISPNLFQFYLAKRKEKVPSMFMLVMIMLHYLPRFQKAPKTTQWVKIITGQEPKSFDDFVLSNKEKLQ